MKGYLRLYTYGHWLKALCCIAFITGLPWMGYAQKSRFRIMEYNVENLFDTIRCMHTEDADFTPEGSHKWSSSRYWKKLSDIGRVIASGGGKQPADLVALIEVENDSVVADLTRKTKLWRLGYEYIITHSKDVRGINVALLYQPYRFRPIGRDSTRVMPVSTKKGRPTRDILHVAGEVPTGDTLDVFVCHLPSRRGGNSASRYRIAVAERLREAIDNVLQQRKRPQIVVTGDFNAYYPEKVFTQALRATAANDVQKAYLPNELYVMTHQMEARRGIKGTYKFQGEWNQLDQMIVNGALLAKQDEDDHRLRTTTQSCKLVDFDFLLQNDKNGDGVHPYRTYLGPYYQGGYSDHLPVILDFYF